MRYYLGIDPGKITLPNHGVVSIWPVLCLKCGETFKTLKGLHTHNSYLHGSIIPKKSLERLYRQRAETPTGHKYFRYYYWHPCSVCEKGYYQERNNYRRTGKVGCCSKECKRIRFTGVNNNNWTGGRRFKKARGGRKLAILVYAPNHPAASHSYVYEHRLIMEKALGRFLEHAELVHHVNLDPLDNRVGNLLLTGNTEHDKMHASLAVCVKDLMEKGALFFDFNARVYRVKI